MSEQQPPRRLTRKELMRRNKRIAKRRQQRAANKRHRNGRMHSAWDVVPPARAVKLRDDDGTMIPDSETVFGIRLESAWIYEGQERSEPMVLAINAAPENVGNIERFLRFLFFKDDVK